MGSPSEEHQGYVLLFENRPELAPELVRDVLGIALPAYGEARLGFAELGQLKPTEFRADCVLLLAAGEPVAGIVVEVQLELRRDDDKLYSWPAYVANLRARTRCPVCLLVIAPDERVAERARTPVDLGFGSMITPHVVGPALVPVVVDVEVARRDPELAVLSAMAHGRGEVTTAVKVARTAAVVVRELRERNEERAMLYFDLIGGSLGDVARVAFEGLMAQGNYVWQSDFAKRHRAEGMAEGKAEVLLDILDERGVALSAEQRARVAECRDDATLRRWTRRALTVASADELFTD